jgi:hypothetical protein
MDFYCVYLYKVLEMSQIDLHWSFFFLLSTVQWYFFWTINFYIAQISINSIKLYIILLTLWHLVLSKQLETRSKVWTHYLALNTFTEALKFLIKFWKLFELLLKVVWNVEYINLYHIGLSKWVCNIFCLIIFLLPQMFPFSTILINLKNWPPKKAILIRKP